MKRTLLTLLAGMLAGSALTLAGVAWWAAGRTPDFYERALTEQPPPEVRAAAAEDFETRTAELAREVEYAAAWDQTFTQRQINSWLAERLPEEYGDELPEGVSDPRVDLSEPGVVRLGFRLKTRRFDGVVSLAVLPEVPRPNRVRLTVRSLHAGILPLSAASFTDDISEALDERRVTHEWEPHEAGCPVLLVTLTPGGAEQPVLEAIEVDDFTVRVTGRRAAARRMTMR